MKSKLIKLNNQYYVINDSPLELGDDFLIRFEDGSGYFHSSHKANSIDVKEQYKDRFKITHSTIYRFETRATILSLNYIESLIYGFSLNFITEKHFEGWSFGDNGKQRAFQFFQAGFKACLKMYEERLFTEGDMDKAIEMGHNTYLSNEDIIDSLKPKDSKTEWDIEINEKYEITIL